MSSIYGLADPETYEIRYVGKTMFRAEGRLEHHLKLSRQNSPYHVHRWIRTLNAKPLLVILEKDPEDINISEQSWIKKLRDIGIKLCNMTKGGDGLQDPIGEIRDRISATLSGRLSTPETRHNMSLGWQRRKAEGKPGTRKGIGNSPITRKRISDAKIGKALSEENRKGISNGVKANWASLSDEERKERGSQISQGIFRKRAL